MVFLGDEGSNVKGLPTARRGAEELLSQSGAFTETKQAVTHGNGLQPRDGSGWEEMVMPRTSSSTMGKRKWTYTRRSVDLCFEMELLDRHTQQLKMS